ncbi:MAG TPA: glycosyltransferase family 4 protein [Ktedonobacterales bacterium]|nr:glycosyltransferase family 4 protein [Ktedonobacterales bacterium]
MRIAMLGLKGIPATYGGVERYTEEVAVRLAERGHEILVYCRGHYTTRAIARKPYRGVRLVRLPSLNRRVTDTLSHSFVSTLDVLRRRPDVAIYHSLGNALFAPVPRIQGTPTALVLHGQEWREDKWAGWPRRFFQASERLSLTSASRVCVIARWLQDDLRTRYGYESTFVSTGVTLPDSQPLARLDTFGLDHRRYLLFVGRLVPEKEVHTLLAAYRGLETDMPLVIVGDTQRQDRYLDELHALAGPNVRFLGFRYGAELADLYSNAYAYILPSAAEGIALTLLEAMAHNNSVVISDIPQNMEAANPLGFVFKTGDADDLRRVLRLLLDQPDLVAERRARSREHVGKRYDWEAVTDHYERLCVELTRDKKG